MPPKQIVSIETTRKRVMGQITVDGVEHDVLQLNFGQNQRLTAVDGTAQYLPAIYDVIAEVMPSLPKETRDNIPLLEGEKIVIFAGGGARAVEAVFPNVVQPEDQTSAV